MMRERRAIARRKYQETSPIFLGWGICSFMPFRPTRSESMNSPRASYDFPAVRNTSRNEVFPPGSDGKTVLPVTKVWQFTLMRRPGHAAESSCPLRNVQTIRHPLGNVRLSGDPVLVRILCPSVGWGTRLLASLRLYTY